MNISGFLVPSLVYFIVDATAHNNCRENAHNFGIFVSNIGLVFDLLGDTSAHDDCRENAHNFGLTFCIRHWVSLFLVPI